MSNFKEFDANIVKMSKKANDISSGTTLTVFTFITEFAQMKRYSVRGNALISTTVFIQLKNGMKSASVMTRKI